MIKMMTDIVPKYPPNPPVNCDSSDVITYQPLYVHHGMFMILLMKDRLRELAYVVEYADRSCTLVIKTDEDEAWIRPYLEGIFDAYVALELPDPDSIMHVGFFKPVWRGTLGNGIGGLVTIYQYDPS